MTYKCKVCYDGKNYFGYQTQTNKPTIQNALETALQQALNKPVKLIASGRTDTGVSALSQVVSFECEEVLDTYKTLKRLNSILPADIRVLEMEKTDDEFHARYSTKEKTYNYLFYISKISNPIYDKFATRIYYNIDFTKFEKELLQVVGTHDFTSLTAANCEQTSKIRTISSATLKQFGDIYVVEVTGNGFLKNMIRILVGTLIDVSRGHIKLSMKEILEKKDRRFAGKTASSLGLILKEVSYSE